MKAQVLKFLLPDLQIGPTEDDEVTVLNVNGDETIIWRSEKTQPTQKEIESAQNDRTVVNGKTFSEWVLEHGGDDTATKKRIARELLERDDRNVDLLIAVSKTLLDGINQLRSQHSMSPISFSQFKQVVKDKLA